MARDVNERLDEIAEEIEELPAMASEEREHRRADELLLEALQLLGGERGQRIAKAWTEGTRHWWWA